MVIKKGNEYLPGISIKRIETLYHNEKNGKAKTRLQCAMLRKEGKTIEDISQITKKPTSTVSDILKRFEGRGVKAKDAIKQTGQPQKLSEKQVKELEKILEKSPKDQGLPFVIWTSKLVQYFIKKRFGVSYVLMQIHRILKKIGFTLQRPRQEHIKTNKQLRQEHKKKFVGELEILGREDMRSYFWTKVPLS